MAAAACGGHLDMVKFFIEKGADEFADGLLNAAEGGHLDVVKFFLTKNEGSLQNCLEDAFCVSGRSGNLEVIEFLGSQTDENGNKPSWEAMLYEAIVNYQMQVLTHVLENKNMDINWDDLLRAAAEAGNKEVLDFFFEKGGPNYGWDWNRFSHRTK